MNAWDDFKFVDGIKLYRGECIICGSEFYDENPYRKNCENKGKHAFVKAQQKERIAWDLVEGFGPDACDANANGGWDNVVRVYENNSGEIIL